MNRQRRTAKIILDPREMFILAEEFLRASRFLAGAQRQSGFPPKDEVPRPNVMIHAVSFELFLKCLFVLDRSRPPERTHNLKDLFQSLAHETKLQMRAHFDPRMGQQALDHFRRNHISALPLGLPSVFTFDFALTASSRAFEHVRFAYERKSRPTEQWFGEPLVRAARQVILDRHPDWSTAPTIGMSKPMFILQSNEGNREK